MKKNLSLISFLIVVCLLSIINSCREDSETLQKKSVYSEIEISSKKYQKKTPFKEDTILIKIAQETFVKHADISYFEDKYGKLYWDYAISLENNEHHSIIIPIIKNNRVVTSMQAVLKNNEFYFLEKKDEKLMAFLHNLIFSRISKFTETNSFLNQDSKIIATNCKTTTLTVGCPPGYSDCQDISYSITSCNYMDDGTGFSGSGNPDQMEICHPEVCGGGGGSYNPELEPILVPPPPPHTPIPDMKKYLSCLNINQSANLKVYAQTMGNGNGVGHAFISITQGNNVMTFGFYPKLGFPYNSTGPGIFGDNSGTFYNYGWNAGTITPTQLQQIIGISIAFSESDYNVMLNNCSDFATYALMVAGINCNTDYVDTPNTVANLISPLAQSSNSYGPQTNRTCP